MPVVCLLINPYWRQASWKRCENLGEVFGDFHQHFHREVMIDRENEHWKQQQQKTKKKQQQKKKQWKSVVKKSVKKTDKRCLLKTWWKVWKAVSFFHENTVKMPNKYCEYQDTCLYSRYCILTSNRHDRRE